MEQLSPCATTTEPALWSLQATSTEAHMPWAHTLQLLKPTHSRACVPQLLSLCAATTETCAPRACAPQQEKPLQGEARAPQ